MISPVLLRLTRPSRDGIVPPRCGTMNFRWGKRPGAPDSTSRSAAAVSSNGAPTSQARLCPACPPGPPGAGTPPRRASRARRTPARTATAAIREQGSLGTSVDIGEIPAGYGAVGGRSGTENSVMPRQVTWFAGASAALIRAVTGPLSAR